MTTRFLVLAVAVALAVVEAASANDNVRAVQMKLREGGFYSGEIDGAYSSQLSAALTRYQIRNGLPITGQLDVDTSKALGVKPAVTTSTANKANDAAQASETWRRLRKSDQQFLARIEKQTAAPSPREQSVVASASATAPVTAVPTNALAPPVEGQTRSATTSGSAPNMERLRDYVGAFVLAGLDPRIGAETEFFADRVRYYDQGVLDRENIRQDLKRYAERWPDRRFWFDGDITVEPQNGNRVRVTFPLRYELRNGDKQSSGKVDKTIVLEPAGDDLEIVAVSERKAE